MHAYINTSLVTGQHDWFGCLGHIILTFHAVTHGIKHNQGIQISQVSQAGISNCISKYCRMQLLIPAWDTCFWHQSPHFTGYTGPSWVNSAQTFSRHSPVSVIIRLCHEIYHLLGWGNECLLSCGSRAWYRGPDLAISIIWKTNKLFLLSYDIMQGWECWMVYVVLKVIFWFWFLEL